MKRFALQKRTWALLAVLVPLFALFVYVALRSGPLAPVPVTLATVEKKSVSPALFGIGTIEARYTQKIGPTIPGRLKAVHVDVGDEVKAGQPIGKMDPVDLADRIRAQEAAIKKAEAQLKEAQIRRDHARNEARRYEQLIEVDATSKEILAARRQEQRVTEAGAVAAQEELSRASAEKEALASQLRNLELVAPVDGLVVSRNQEPGSTVVAGESVVEIIDPESLWINVRFDQVNAQGLAARLTAGVTLRSREGRLHEARVLRVEPLADPVTEETLAKVVFNEIPEPPPPIGELVEVTVQLPPLPPVPVLPSAAVRRIGGELGVWQVEDGGLNFTHVILGTSDLSGQIQVRQGLEAGDRVVLYSEKALTARTRIHVVEGLPGVRP